MLTTEELAVLDTLKTAWDQFLALPSSIQDGASATDGKDFCYLIHRLEDMIVARSGYREIHKG